MARIQTIFSEYRHDAGSTPAQVMRTTLLNRISWGAVLAGVVIAFSAQLFLNLLGMSVGLSSPVSVSGAEIPSFELSWKNAAWWIFAGILASFSGGFAAGRLAGEPKFSTSAWHGLVTWATSLLFVVILMGTAAGATINMGGPLKVIVNGNVAAYSLKSPSSLQVVNPDGSSVSSGARGVFVESADIKNAALTSAIALILSALAAWYGGRAGTIRTAREEDVVMRPEH